MVLRSNFALLLTIQFSSLFIYFFLFSPQFCPGHISGTVTRRDSKLCVLLGLLSNFSLLLTIQFASLFFFFSATILPRFLSGPYLWNRYSQILQMECAAWSCGLIVHYCLTSNSLCYFIFFFSATILSGPYLWNRYSQRLQIECAAWSCGLIVHCCLPSNSLC